MTTSVSNSTTNTSLLQLQDFKNGTLNITKTDLEEYVKTQKDSGKEVSEDVQEIIDSYDRVDMNGDGVSYTELQNFNVRQDLIESCQNIDSTLISTIFGSSSSSSASSVQNLLLSYLSNDSTSSSATSSVLNSLSTTNSTTSNLLSYLNSNSDTDYSSLMSYLENSSGSVTYDSIVNYIAEESDSSTSSTSADALSEYVKTLANSTSGGSASLVDYL